MSETRATPTVTLPAAGELREIVEQVFWSYLDGGIVAVPGPDHPACYSGHVLGCVSISGSWSGHVFVACTSGGACKIASGMFQLGDGEVTTAEVADALGELTNMVGGAVKGMLGAGAVLSLPQVVLDGSALISPETTRMVTVHAQWKDEPLEFSVWERGTENRRRVNGTGVQT
jgi:chemotaxis protein CheX